MSEPRPAPVGYEPVRQSVAPESVIPAPTPPSLDQLRYEAHIINRSSDPRKKAREMAEEQLRAEMRKGKWYNPIDWVKKTKFRLGEEYYRQKFTQRALEAMITNNNSYLQMDVVKNGSVQATEKLVEERQAGQAKVEQVKEMSTLKQASGENFEGQKIVAAQTNTEKLVTDFLIKPLVEQMQTMSPADLSKLANLSEMSRRPLEAQLQQKLSSWIKALGDSQVMAGLDPQIRTLLSDPNVKTQLLDLFGRDATVYKTIADYFATDLIDVSQKIVSDHNAHGYAIDQQLQRTKVTLANTSWGAETSATFNVVDKFIAKMQSNRITGALVNPATIGFAASMATNLFIRAPGSVARIGHLAVPVVGAVGGGAYAAFRRSYDLKVDRASHQVDRAYGGKKVTRADVDAQLSGLSPFKRWVATKAGAYRRADIEKFAYNSKSVPVLINEISESLQNLSTEANQDVLAQKIADLRARLNVSASNKIDLITYTGKEQTEQGRLALIKAIATAKVEMRRTLRTSGLDQAGVDHAMQEFEQKINNQYSTSEQSFLQDRKQQDKAFAGYRLKQSVKAGGRGAVCGFVFGLAGEEAITLIRRGAEELGGAVGFGIPTRSVGETNLEHLINKVGDLAQGKTHVDSPDVLGMRDLAGQPGGGAVDFNDHLQLRVDNAHNGLLFDQAGNVRTDVPPIIQEADGSLRILGKLPADIANDLHQINFKVQTEVGSTLLDTTTPVHEFIIHTGTQDIKTMVPQGTEWIPDTVAGKWDLVLSADHTRVLVENAEFDDHGLIANYDSSTLGIDTGKMVDTAGAMVSPDGNWSEHGYKLDSYQWYNYDQPGSQLNELKLYTFKIGETVRLSMHDMAKSMSSGLDPNEINVPDVYQGVNPPGGQAGYAFSLPNHWRQPIVALSDNNGFLDLNPSDNDPTHFVRIIESDGTVKNMQLGEFSKIVVDETKYQGLLDGNIATEAARRFDVWKVGGPNGEYGLVSAGRFIEQNGKHVWQSFATIRGKGLPGGEELIPPVITPNLITDEVTKVIPPAESLPFAIPFVPRYPLPPIDMLIPPQPYIPSVIPSVIPQEGLTYSYLGVSGGRSRKVFKSKNSDGSYTYYRPFDDTNRWLETRSPTLQTNPEAQLDQQQEINGYFNRFSPERKSRIDSLSSQISEPMKSEVRGVITIPVAAAVETENVVKTLELLTQQNHTNNNDFEVVLYLNWMENADMSKVARTIQEVGSFMRRHPNFPLRVITEQLKRDTFAIGDVMKTVNDVALKRIKDAGITEDVMTTVLPADVKGISKSFVDEMLKNSKGNKDIYTSKIDFGTMYYEKFPGFHVPMRVLQALIRVSESSYPAPIFTAGAGLQIKSSMLAAIGNYDETLKMGEDANIGMKCVAARLGTKDEYRLDEYPIGRSSLNMWVEVDPARLLACYRRGDSILSAWSDFAEGGYKARPINPARTNEDVNTEWNEIVERMEAQLSSLNTNYDPELINKAFNLMLFGKESWERTSEGKIVLTLEGKAKLHEALKEYKEKQYADIKYQDTTGRNDIKGVKVSES